LINCFGEKRIDRKQKINQGTRGIVNVIIEMGDGYNSARQETDCSLCKGCTESRSPKYAYWASWGSGSLERPIDLGIAEVMRLFLYLEQVRARRLAVLPSAAKNFD